MLISCLSLSVSVCLSLVPVCLYMCLCLCVSVCFVCFVSGATDRDPPPPPRSHPHAGTEPEVNNTHKRNTSRVCCVVGARGWDGMGWHGTAAWMHHDVGHVTNVSKCMCKCMDVYVHVWCMTCVSSRTACVCVRVCCSSPLPSLSW